MAQMEPILTSKSQFYNYRRAMLIDFDLKFPTLSGVLGDVEAHQALGALPDGHEANPVLPGAEPDVPPDGANADERATYQIRYDRWKRREDLCTKHRSEVRKVCGYIVNSVQGEARVRLTVHEEFNDVYAEKDYRRLWQIVLELFMPVGALQTEVVHRLYQSVLNIKMSKNESLSDYQGRFSQLRTELSDLGGNIEDEILSTSYVQGLSDLYVGLKQHVVTLNRVPGLQELKRLSESWPVAQGPPYAARSTTKPPAASEQKANQTKQGARRDGQPRTSRRACHVCGDESHLAWQCPKRATASASSSVMLGEKVEVAGATETSST